MAECLWKPSEDRIRNTNMFRFMTTVNEKYGKPFADYPALYEWSIDHIADFWETFWDFAGIIHSRSYDRVVDDPGKMPGAQWFSGARLNFAENLLRYRDDRTALVFRGEDAVRRTMTYAELYDAVARVAVSSGQVLAVLVGMVIVGGIKRIGKLLL